MIPQVDSDGNLEGSDRSESTAAINEVLQAEDDLQDAMATGDEQTRDKVEDVRDDAYSAVADIASSSGGSGASSGGDPVTVEEPTQQPENQPESDPGSTVEQPDPTTPADVRPSGSGSGGFGFDLDLDSSTLLAGGGILVGLLLVAGGGFGG